MMGFNEVQQKILQFRDKRVQNFKRVFPKISMDEETNATTNHTSQKSNHSTSRIKRSKRSRVSKAVAPETMFMDMKGSNNADVIATVYIYSFM